MFSFSLCVSSCIYFVFMHRVALLCLPIRWEVTDSHVYGAILESYINPYIYFQVCIYYILLK